LRAVDGFSRLLQQEYSDQLNSEARSCLDRICDATERMEQLINGLLNLSQISRAPLHSRPVNLSALAKSVAAELHESEPKRNVRFTIAPDLHAEGDPDLLRSVLQNLIGNAWKFTRGRPEATITIGCRREPAETIYFVTDNGAGFEMKYADKLFGVFQRLHHPEEFEGTGVGLAIVQRIVQRHGGRVWAEGDVGRGATFSFSLPVAGHVVESTQLAAG
jgi:light-regulated signal transduction histidine kinase (bacteriophytochrome)